MRWGVIVFPGSCDDQDVVDSLKTRFGPERSNRSGTKMSLRGRLRLSRLARRIFLWRLSCVAARWRAFRRSCAAVVKFAAERRLRARASATAFKFSARRVCCPARWCATPASLHLPARAPAGRGCRHAVHDRAAKKGQLLRPSHQARRRVLFRRRGDARTLRKNRQVLLRYGDAKGKSTPEANPNGSLGQYRRHLQSRAQCLRVDAASRACLRKLLGSDDGLKIFPSIAVAPRESDAAPWLKEASRRLMQPAVTPELVASTGSRPRSTKRSSAILGREPNYTELGVFSVMWSEHCSYKSSRAYLKQFADRRPRCAAGPGRERRRCRYRRRPGRGVQDGKPQSPVVHRAVSRRGDRRRAASCATFSPWARGRSRRSIRCASAASIIRARAIWLPAWSPASAATATASACRPSAARFISTEATIATFWSTPLRSAWSTRTNDFHAASPTASAIRSCTSAPRPAATGSMARAHGIGRRSREAEEQAPPTVQVGDPFTEKLLLEACLELMRDRTTFVGIQDMGAAGLTCSSAEMAGARRIGHRPRSIGPAARDAA